MAENDHPPQSTDLLDGKTVKAAPLLPPLTDDKGNVYLPAFPAPGLVSFQLELDEVLALRQWHADRAATFAAKGEAANWETAETRAKQLLLVATQIPSPMQGLLQRMVNGEQADA